MLYEFTLTTQVHRIRLEEWLLIQETSRYAVDIVSISGTRFSDARQVEGHGGGFKFFWKGRNSD